MIAELTKQDVHKLVRAAEIILQQRQGEQINEEEACKLLGITKKTIQNMVSNQSIPPSMYTVGIGGNRFYFKNKLINTNK